MKDEVLVDSCVWSLGLRRQRSSESQVVNELNRLLGKNHALLLGIVRQEVLSGVPQPAQFQQLDELLSAIINQPVVDEDYRQAARGYNACRTLGIQGSHVDFLICAVALRLDVAVFTTDRDFMRYEPILGFRLHEVGC